MSVSFIILGKQFPFFLQTRETRFSVRISFKQQYQTKSKVKTNVVPPSPPTYYSKVLSYFNSGMAEPKTQWFNFLVKVERTNTHTPTKKASEHLPCHFSGAQIPRSSRPPLSLFCCKYPGRGRLNITFSACPRRVLLITGWWLQAAQIFSSPSKDKSETPSAGPGQAIRRSDYRYFSHC